MNKAVTKEKYILIMISELEQIVAVDICTTPCVGNISTANIWIGDKLLVSSAVIVRVNLLYWLIKYSNSKVYTSMWFFHCWLNCRKALYPAYSSSLAKRHLPTPTYVTPLRNVYGCAPTSSHSSAQ
jgi:hypothetical protein